MIRDLPLLSARPRCATPKGKPAILAKKDKARSREEQAKAFRDAVWARDGGKSRATGKPLVRSGTIDGDKLGEVDHAIPRSLAPERIYDTSNGILLSKHENRLRKVPCCRAPEHKYFDYTGPDDRSKPQTFVWRNDDGTVLKTRKG